MSMDYASCFYDDGGDMYCLLSLAILPEISCEAVHSQRKGYLKHNIG